MRIFCKERGVTYLSRTRIDWEPLLSIHLQESPYYLANQAEFDKLEYQYGHSLDQAQIAPIYIKKIDDIIGYGVFAAKNIKRHDFVGEYAGVVQVSGKQTHCYQKTTGYESDYSWYYVDELEQAPNLEINGRLESNEMRFVNHGSPPNLSVEHTLHRGQWALFFTAQTDLKKDEQLLISYGEAYWEKGVRSKPSISHLKKSD